MTVEMTNVRPEAKIAGEWWAKQLENPVFNNGGNSIMDLIVGGLSMIKAEGRLTKKDIQQVELLITEHVNDRLLNEVDPVINLSVDYAPDGELLEILNKVGSHAVQNAPWKTTMTISPGLVAYVNRNDGQRILYEHISHYRRMINVLTESLARPESNEGMRAIYASSLEEMAQGVVDTLPTNITHTPHIDTNSIYPYETFIKLHEGNNSLTTYILGQYLSKLKLKKMIKNGFNTVIRFNEDEDPEITDVFLLGLFNDVIHEMTPSVFLRQFSFRGNEKTLNKVNIIIKRIVAQYDIDKGVK